MAKTVDLNDGLLLTGISYKTSWFMFHRLRFGMTQHPFITKLKGVVEVDETWIGPKEKGNPGMPNPARTAQVPFPPGSHANPTRGCHNARALFSSRQECPINGSVWYTPF